MENLTSQASFPTLGQITSQWSTNGLTAQASTCPSPLNYSLGMDMFMWDPIRQIMAAQSCPSSLFSQNGQWAWQEVSTSAGTLLVFSTVVFSVLSTGPWTKKVLNFCWGKKIKKLTYLSNP